MAIETLLVGRTLGGRYQIERIIGKGGMGAVFAATDHRLRRQVAVKVILEAAGGREKEIRARFIREATVVAGLHDLHVVAVHDFGTDAELDLDFLVMELLEGENLDQYLRRCGTPHPDLARSILMGAARGLAAGHKAKLVHRDVKPANLFVSSLGPNHLHVRVLDFGIVDVAQTGAATRLTQFGVSPCTPYFASPEQLRGERLSPASDVYSLGVVAFLLLAGYGPFLDERTDQAANSPLPLRPLPAAVPEALRKVVARALSFNPLQRFADAGALAQALEGIDAVAPGQRHRETPTVATPASAPMPLPLPVPALRPRGRWNPLPWIGASVVAAVLVAAVLRGVGSVGSGVVEPVAVASFVPATQPAVTDIGDHDDTGRLGPEVLSIRRDFNYIEDHLGSFARARKEIAGVAADSAFAYVYQDRSGVRKVRVRIYSGPERKLMDFFYTSGELIFAFVVTPSTAFGTPRDEERFYFQDGRMIRWLDNRRHSVPAEDPVFGRNERLLACEGHRLLEASPALESVVALDWRSCTS